MYTKEISRANPTCILFLIDQSTSMNDPFGEGEGKSKADGVADAINELLSEIIIGATDTKEVKDYCDVGVIGYGAKVGPAFSGPLAGHKLVPLSKVYANPKLEERDRIVEVEDEAGNLVKTIEKYKLPIWFEPVANGRTPMCEALRLAHSLLEPWVADHPESYPPIVMNLTDGDVTDGNPNEPAEAIKQLTTNDGNVLLFNCHVSSKRAEPIRYPDTEEGLPDEFAIQLFHISSLLPSGIREIASQEGFKLGPNARGFVFNANLVEVIRLLEWGTRQF